MAVGDRAGNFEGLTPTRLGREVPAASAPCTLDAKALPTMAPLAGGTPTPVPDAVVSAGASLFLAGETLYFVRNSGANALNGVYSYTAGDATVKQLVASNAIVAVIADERGIYYKVSGDYHVYKAKLTGSAGVAIADSVYGGDFTGQDDTFIYQAYPWGSGGPAQAIIK